MLFCGHNLILAVAIFLAGLYLGWRLCILGVLLRGTLVLATYLEEFFWIIMMVVLASASARRQTHAIGYIREEEYRRR